ncbi:uncharacterized protein K441DRAFT_690019 [Cenococcum geophilum 1.58]|uniref:uncharacterized protein n=1 Tax=Cenococcum geophilum 1.58 TaxID=794803 RepID=UPI00358EEF3B|nr:hypothetical protein K441DRAFT_690019 [Cenococcum geophilum 1.58]
MDQADSQANVEQFAYDSLPNPSSIRLLRRDGRDSSGRLSFFLDTVDLHDQPYYHCLSYTWGNPHADGSLFGTYFQQRAPEYGPGRSYPVIINGKLLNIGKNLHDAMEQLPKDCWANRVKRVYKHLDGRLTIHIAAKLGSQAVLRSHLQHGADASARDAGGKTPVHYAAMYGHLAAVKELVSARADVTIKDNKGKMPIAYAWENKNEEIVHYLVKCMMPDFRATTREASTISKSFDDLTWIDAICINQQDVGERNAQVAIMDRIYERAGYVLAWLGDEDPSTATGVETLQKISAAGDAIKSCRIIPYQTCDPAEYEREGTPPISMFEWNSLAAIFARQWFRRIWIVQEFVFATDLIAYCGKHEILFSDVSRVCDVLTTLYRKLGYESSQRYVPLDQVATSLEYFYEMLQKIRDERIGLANRFTRENGRPFGSLFSLPNLVTTTFPFHATDPRDKIFSLAALLTLGPNPQSAFRPDYSRPVQVCYTWATAEIIMQTGNLGVLAWVQDAAHKLLSNLPTWVPDYSRRGTSPLPSSYFNVFPTPRQNPVRLDPPGSPGNFTLGLAGFEWDTVELVAGPRQPKFKLDASWFNLALHLRITYHTGQPRSEVLWRTLCADQDIHKIHPAPANLQHSFKSLICALICENAEKRLDSCLSLASGAAQIANRLDGRVNENNHGAVVRISNIQTQLREKTRLDSDWFNPVRSSLQDLLLLSLTESPSATSRSHTPSLREIEQFFQTAQTRPEETTEAISAQSKGPFALAYSHVYGGRRLFITSKKYLGLGPESLKVGDSIFLLSGGKMPLILRPIVVGERPDRGGRNFHLVGEAYVHGIMHGEAVSYENNTQPTVEEVTLL